MIPLLLKFAALQVRQVIDVVNVVKAAAVALEAEFAGVVALQQVHIFLIQACQTAGDAALLGIGDDGVQHRQYLALAHGEGIDGSAVKLGENDPVAVHQGSPLATPDAQIGEGVFTALFGGQQQRMQLLPLAQVDLLKIDHNEHPFV